MADNIDITVNETIDNIVINSAITTDIIDFNLYATTETINIDVTPELTTVNINSVSGGGLVTSVNGEIGDVTGLVPYIGASQDLDLGINDLYTKKVFLFDEIAENYGSIHYADGDLHIEDADGHKLLVIEDGFMQLHLSDTIQSNLFTTLLTQTRDHYLPNNSGTIALTSDITGTNSGTNTGDETATTIKSKLGITTLSGNNTGDQDLSGKVDKVTGKGLSTNDYTTAEQTKVSNLSGTNSGDNATNTQYSGLASSKENTITAGTTSQYYRGDKSFQTLDKTAVGLSNVDNTTDANKPVSTAQATAIALKEDSSNKSTLTTDSASTTKFPVWSAILSYFDAARIRTLLGITTLSGSNTGDQDLSGYVPTSRTINGKALSANVSTRIVSATDSSALTGTGVETILKSITIPANFFAASDIMTLDGLDMISTGVLGSKNLRFYVNTSVAIPATLIAQMNNTASSVYAGNITRKWIIKGGNIEFPTPGNITTPSNSVTSSSSSRVTLAFDVTVQNYLIITGLIGNNADSMFITGGRIS